VTAKPGEATADDILERLRAFYEGLVAGNLAPADKLFDFDNLVMHEPEGLPYGGTYHGKKGLLDGITAINAVWKRVRFSDLRYSVGEDLAIVHFTMTATSRATGKELLMPVCEVWRFRNGLAFDVSPFYWDTHAVRGLIGLQ
jgi:ketosteroid isomerase-like protein